MVDLKMALNLVAHLVALGAAFFLMAWWYRLSRLFRGGTMGRTFGLSVSAIALIAIAESSDLIVQLGLVGTGDLSNYLSLVHGALEVGFFVVLALAMKGFYSVWFTGLSKAQERVESPVSNLKT